MSAVNCITLAFSFSSFWQHDGSGSLHDVQLSLPSSPEPEDGDQICKVWWLGSHAELKKNYY